MRQLFTLASLLLLSSMHAQITIGQADMPSAGDTMRFHTTTGAAVDVDLTGANTLWDFGFLTPDQADADTAVAVSSTPLLYQFFFNSPLYPAHQSDFAMKGQDFGFQTFLTVSNVYDFYKKEPGYYANVGFGANINGLPTSVRRIPVDLIHLFPLNFGDTDSSFSSFTLNVPSLFSFTQDQLRINEVDGWGTLYLPADTFQVLRVRSVLQRSDTVFIEQFGQGFRFDEPETVEHKWIAQGMDAPVLSITTVAGQVTTIRFFYQPDEVETSIAARAAGNAPVLFPNPAEGTVRLHLPTTFSGTVSLFDAQGRSVATLAHVVGGTEVVLPTQGLPSGVYTVHGSGVGSAWSERLVLRR